MESQASPALEARSVSPSHEAQLRAQSQEEIDSVFNIKTIANLLADLGKEVPIGSQENPLEPASDSQHTRSSSGDPEHEAISRPLDEQTDNGQQVRKCESKLVKV